MGRRGMAMGRLSNRRMSGGTGSRLAVALAPRHAFYDHCNEVLAEAEFDEAVEMLCQPYYTDGLGRPSLPPGRYFRMLFVSQFEGLASEREIAWRCADSLSLHRFLRLAEGATVPNPSTLSVTRSRRPLEVRWRFVGGSPRWVRLHSGDRAPARSGARQAERGRCFDSAGECLAAPPGSAGHRRGLSPDAGAPGPRERYRDADPSGPGPLQP